tara:strand:- start:224 stop:919 length:696 start_codon:yes stop_codon:yes gene_type:complete
MNREPESELMNKEEQVIAYAEADFSLGERNFIKFIKKYLEKNKINLSENDLIVDLGCGPGNISEKLSDYWPDVNVLGIDGSKEMIKKAKANLIKNKINKRFSNLSYLCTDIRNIDKTKVFSDKPISLLVSNSFIHHIINLDKFFEFINNLSSEKTINFHKDLIRPKDKNIALGLKAKCAEKYNNILTNDYYASLKASYRKVEIEAKLKELKLNSIEVIEESQEYLIVYGKV